MPRVRFDDTHPRLRRLPCSIQVWSVLHKRHLRFRGTTVHFLTGKRILVVEDEALIAVMVEDMLTDLGNVVVGPVATIEQALALVRTEAIDAAVLDVNVRGEHIDPVADALSARGVPMLFATGYGEVRLASAAAATVIDKPYTQDKLARGLAAVMGANPPHRGTD